MNLILSELFQTVGVTVAAFAILTLLALCGKAESATWKQSPTKESP
ncbi:MAG: hypothetical protein PHO14_07360 [Kiritimatiellae bacterium]|jgi:hypothetical protein|nr:hypothetical protein [Kiritimatiellia bacterium]MDD4342036.1 hypothetical protein [Kiritimatiellia bacterium]MDY0149729.1 hypothetical protein [Kiritimatiellia bacterium]